MPYLYASYVGTEYWSALSSILFCVAYIFYRKQLSRMPSLEFFCPCNAYIMHTVSQQFSVKCFSYMCL